MAKKTNSVKSTSVTRKVDTLGRIVIPKELRRSFNIVDDKDFLEIYVEGDKIILKKYVDGCFFCGAEDNLCEYREKLICENCVKEIANSVVK